MGPSGPPWCPGRDLEPADSPEKTDAYSRLEFPGTYFLAFRDLPALLAEHVGGRRAMDFGCGAGRSTRDYPENRAAKSGDVVWIVMTDVTDRRPVEDIVCTEDTYRELYRDSGLGVLATHERLGRPDEPYPWVSETRIAPWRIDVLKKA